MSEKHVTICRFCCFTTGSALTFFAGFPMYLFLLSHLDLSISVSLRTSVFTTLQPLPHTELLFYTHLHKRVLTSLSDVACFFVFKQAGSELLCKNPVLTMQHLQAIKRFRKVLSKVGSKVNGSEDRLGPDDVLAISADVCSSDLGDF